MLRAFRPATIPCLKAGCTKLFKTLGGRKRHDNAAHAGGGVGPVAAHGETPASPRADPPLPHEHAVDGPEPELEPAIPQPLEDLAPAGAGGLPNNSSITVTHPTITGECSYAFISRQIY